MRFEQFLSNFVLISQFLLNFKQCKMLIIVRENALDLFDFNLRCMRTLHILYIRTYVHIIITALYIYMCISVGTVYWYVYMYIASIFVAFHR